MREGIEMRKQLTLQDMVNIYLELRRRGMSEEKALNLPIYIGNDDELNGIHTAWFAETINAKSKDEGEQYLVSMINDYGCNNKLKGLGVLIS
jgi:hypothetical protein